MDINNLIGDLDKFFITEEMPLEKNIVEDKSRDSSNDSDSDSDHAKSEKKLAEVTVSEDEDDEEIVYWLYSARSGWWWIFDTKSIDIIENVYQSKGKFVNLTLSNGNVVTIDLTTNKQTTIKGNGAPRNVFRTTDIKKLKVRGIAGKYF